MDVHCTTCGEPWDVDYLSHYAIFETPLSEHEAQAWLEIPPANQLTPRYRKRFASQGWLFGTTVLNVVNCPCCPDEAKAITDMLSCKRGVEPLLPGDPDGMAALLEDLGY